MRNRLTSKRGVSLIELIVYASVLTAVGLWVANFLKTPIKFSQSVQQARTQKNLNYALDAIASELRETDHLCITAFVPLLPIASPPSTIPAFTKSTYNLANPNPTVTQIQYDVQQAVGGQTATVGRTVAGTARQLLFQAANPSVSLTLQLSAPSLNVIDVTLIHTDASKPTAVVTTAYRRVCVRS